MSFACNGLVVYTVARTKFLQQPPLLMLCSLALTDVLFSLYAIYRYIEVLAHRYMCPESVSPEKGGLSALCLLATLGNLAIISRDRYLAVRKPWWYHTHVTKSRAMKLMCVPNNFISIVLIKKASRPISSYRRNHVSFVFSHLLFCDYFLLSWNFFYEDSA